MKRGNAITTKHWLVVVLLTFLVTSGFSFYSLFKDTGDGYSILIVPNVGEHIEIDYYGQAIIYRPRGFGMKGPRTLDGGMGE